MHLHKERICKSGNTMSWFIRLKLSMLPVLDSENVDAQILYQDICARLGHPYPFSEKVKTKEAIRVFYSAASAEGYIDDMNNPCEFFTSRYGYTWNRIGHCLVLIYSTVPIYVPCKCIVRTAESVWELYDLLHTVEPSENMP